MIHTSLCLSGPSGAGIKCRLTLQVLLNRFCSRADNSAQDAAFLVRGALDSMGRF